MIPHPKLPVLTKKIAFSAFVQLGGKALQLILAVISTKLISSFLIENDYGLYGKITEYALLFSVIGNLGIFANVVRKMADNPNDGKIFINSLMVRIFTGLVIFASAIGILIITRQDHVFILGTMLFSAGIFFDFITSICDGMLQANYLMGRATFAHVLGRVINFATVFFVIYFATRFTTETSFILLFSASLTGSIFTAILSYYFVRKKINFIWKIDVPFMLEVLKTSIPFGLVTLINNLYFRFLPDYFSSIAISNSQFATFHISAKVASVLSLLSTFVVFSALPGLKQYIDEKDWTKAIKLYKKLWKFFIFAGLLVITTGTIFGPKIIEILTHKKYFLPEFWFILPLMLVLAAISYGYDLILITLFAIEKDWWLLKQECIALVIAFTVSLSSLLTSSLQIKLFLIIFAAILGEIYMVVRGTKKVKKYFQHMSSISQ